MSKTWIAPQRNWKGIRFEKLRKNVDPKFNEAHDRLSKAYYTKTAFIWKGKDWGILDKELFDKLHGLIFHLRTMAFDKTNKMLPAKQQVPEDEYNSIYDDKRNLVDKHTARAAKIIAQLKKKGIELEI